MAELFFDLDTAERLLPELTRLLPIAIESKKQILEADAELTRVAQKITAAGGSSIDVGPLARRKQEKEEWTSRLRGAAEKIENCGCLVKDLEMGLIDFPSRFGGREMYLCWKLGEPSIQFWHYTDEGFAGRKRIDAKLCAELRRPKPS